MNLVFFLIVLIAFVFAGWHQILWVPVEGVASPIEALSVAMVESAGGAVELAIGLVGVMTLFLGLMKIAEEGGLLKVISRLIRPLMVRLFPDVPPDHPAMGAMILNMSANALGLGNAATPFGIRAMQELDKLNSNKGTATDAMALFLAINTSSITLLPTGIIALRAAAGSADPAGILPTTLFATMGSTTVAIIAAKMYSRFSKVKKKANFAEAANNATDTANDSDSLVAADSLSSGYPLWVSIIALCVLASFIPLTVIYGKVISPWIIPSLMIAFLTFGVFRRVSVYEVFVEGAKEGFQVAIKIIPYLVAILVAVGMFRASGAMDTMVTFLGAWTGKVGLPAEALPMALLRPLSGSGAYGIVASVINDPAIGPDSYAGYLVSTLQGSTETTFYVLAVYFGAVQVKRLRHTLAAALSADVAGVIFAVIACYYLFG
ncbi:MAG: spore maturation protein [Desulfobacteraceae bacterium]|nr:spore maturation protein [Desulfobacteraceae bacterium]MBC2755992.1 spore maturation protein [Desulfobacteraceae bacterium]